jgi:hypothetical protein
VQLLLAGDVGRVRDVLGPSERTASTIGLYPTVQAAIDAIASDKSSSPATG